MAKIITMTSDVPNDNGDEVTEGRTLVVPQSIDEDGDVVYVRLTFDASVEGVGSLVDKVWRSLPKAFRDAIMADPERTMIVAEPGPRRASSTSGTSDRATREANKVKRDTLRDLGWDIRPGGRLSVEAEAAYERHVAGGDGRPPAAKGEAPAESGEAPSGDDSGQDGADTVDAADDSGSDVTAPDA